jgi:hypothetical protein
MARAGILERVMIQTSGHGARPILDRYHIVGEGGLARGGQMAWTCFALLNSYPVNSPPLVLDRGASVSH